MIETLVAALNTRDSRLDWRDLADSLWLAIHTPRSGDEQHTEPVSAPAQPSKATAVGHSPAVGSPSAVNPPVGREPSPTIAWQRNPLELELDRADTGQSAPPTITPGGLEFAPDHENESLPGELRIARALRPLRHRRRPSRNTTTNTALNVDETIEHFCRTRELIPILEPATERWFREAAVVVDGGPTMIVWREMVAAFTRLLGREGAFERVTQWTLDYESGPPVLRDRGGTGYPTGQLVDYAGRRLIFLFSDCVSELWRDSRAAWDVLELWGRFDPVVLVQTLPWRLWPATALASGEVAVSGQQRGNANRLLRVRLPWWSMEEHATAIGTPIVTLDESMLGDWAHMLMARGRRSVPGVIAPVLEQSPIASRPTKSDIDPRAIVETFHATASEPATRLATLLSAVEVDLTIARLILRELVPGGRQVHVAEVLASGLLQRPKPNTPESFDFTPGTREILHESISKTTALDVWRTIAPHLERTGRKGAFSIVLDRAARKGQQTTAMARIAGELADRLGIEPWIEAPLAAATVSESESESRSLMEWTAQQERRRVEFRTRLLTRAMGNYDDKGWWFCGRHTALAAIATWLTHPEPDRSMLVVTGAPGSGKSAVLGLITALADAEYRTNAVQVLDLPPEVIPAVGAVDVAIYAQNLGVDQVRDGIAAAARVTAATVDELARALAQRTAVLTVLIDALDEATDGHAVAGKLLRPLIDRAGGRLRLLIGTRRTVLEDLGADRDTIDLDSAQHADYTATIDYIERVLRGSSPGTVYADCEPDQVRAIAAAIADQADGSFLVAMIVAAALSGTREIPDPDDLEWRRSLPKLPGEAMAHDLRSRLGDAAARAQNLLLPLAFAEGQGLPDKELWAPLASRIAAVEYNHDDLTWLFRTAGSYVVEAREAGYSAYRLHHQALAEYLAKDLAHDAVHAMFVEVLRQRVPTLPDGSREWSGAHPYILRHLATHAAHAGLVDELVTDMDYLVHAEPTALLGVLSTVVTAPAQLIRAVYRCSATHHRRLPPAGRRQILAVDAARFQARDRQEQLNRTLDWPARWATGNLIDPAHRATLTGHVGAVTSVACMTIDDRPVAVTAGHDRMVRVWDLDAELERAVLTGHTDWVIAAACTVVDGRPVAVTTSFDGTVRVWDLRAGAEIRVFTGHTD
ncbi:SAV_2336 N-terminal domain-related protein, partial [Nocardia vinacea]|uniref:SAV_2336 N-terminal domain-related protein n=1 Tax=Nocardia vinacea TaxID=96468 RepID=UPI001C3F2BAA